jgi:hypothetical protein
LLRGSALGTLPRSRIAPYSTLSAPRPSRIAPLLASCTLCRLQIALHSVLGISVPVYGSLRTLTLCARRADHRLLHAQHFEFRTGHGLLHVRHLAFSSDRGYLRDPHFAPCAARGCLRVQHLEALPQARSTPHLTLIAPPRTWIAPCTTLGSLFHLRISPHPSLSARC